MLNLIISHSADWDGMMSAAIALDSVSGAECILMNYGDDIPYDKLSAADRIYLTDFSLPVEVMKEYAGKIILLDHHAPKLIELDQKIGFQKFYDYHVDTEGERSGALLTWEYFHRNEGVPVVVDWISIYDIFLKSSWMWADAYNFQLGLRLLNMTVETAKSLLELDRNELVKIINDGSTYSRFVAKDAVKAFEDYSWEVNLCDGIKTKAILTSNMQSTFSNPILESGIADVVIMLNRLDNQRFRLSVRVADNCDFDASNFCKRFGGGGHKKAAGCIICQDDFDNLYREGWI